MKSKTLADEYQRLTPKREPFLKRGREYAALTIPSVLPPLGYSDTSDLTEPYQGFGSRAVTNLSSKLLTAMLPVGLSGFRLRVPNQTLIKSQNLSAPPEIEQGLARSEMLMNSEIERSAWRMPTITTLQLIIVTGNALEQMQPDNSIRTYRLDSFVVTRSGDDKLLQIIIEDMQSPDSLEPAARSVVDPKKLKDDNDIPVYTVYRRKRNGDYDSWQEIDGKMIPGSRGSYKADVLPVWHIRWSIVPKSAYGRGKIEEHIGDLRAYDNYSRSRQEGAAMAARHITLVRPNAAGGNLRQKIAKANNGDVLAGNPDDVHMLQFENVTGIQLAADAMKELAPQLAAAFLLSSDLRRDAERVTAFELRMLAEELESALGGVYSLLSQELSKPRLRRLVHQMHDRGQLPKWNKDMVDTQVTTGLEALGREQDVMRVQSAGQVVAGLGEGVMEYVKVPVLLQKAFNGLQLSDCVRTDAEVQQMRDQDAQRQALAAGAGTALGAAGSAAVQTAQQPPA